MRKTTMKTTPNDHAADADAVADAQVHADEIARDEAAVKAEDAAFEARGKTVDASEETKRAKADAAKRKAVSQFAAVLAAIRLRDMILFDILALIRGRGVSVVEVIDKMTYLGHDPELVGVVIGETWGLEVRNGYLWERCIIR